MAGQIFIEANEVDVAGLPSGAMHLYLVFRDVNGAEYVTRSGPEKPFLPWFGEMKIEANVPIDASADRRGSETPEDRLSTPLDFPDLTDGQAWALMAKYAHMLDRADYPYEVADENSNAFVGAMLAAAGGDPLTMLPPGVSRSEAVGVSNYRDILADAPPPKNGTVRGTSGADRITGIQIDEVIRALGGDDVVRGGRGDDQIHGGTDNDLLHGQVGADKLTGGSGADRLYGGSGADRLDGGTGRNTLTGGADADVFVFDRASTNRIHDFEEGVDRIRIRDGMTVGFEDLAVTSFGSSDEHTRVTYENAVIDLVNFGRALLNARDLEFAIA